MSADLTMSDAHSLALDQIIDLLKEKQHYRERAHRAEAKVDRALQHLLTGDLNRTILTDLLSG